MSVLYKHIIQVENKNVGLKVGGGGGGAQTYHCPPLSKMWGGTCPLAPPHPHPLPTPVVSVCGNYNKNNNNNKPTQMMKFTVLLSAWHLLLFHLFALTICLLGTTVNDKHNNGQEGRKYFI